jgi:hypothetical protein
VRYTASLSHAVQRLTQGIQPDFINRLLDPVIHPAFSPPEREQQTKFIRSSSPRHYPMSRSSPKSSSTCLTNFAIAQIPSLSFSTCLSVEVIVVRVRMTSQLPVLQEATCLYLPFMVASSTSRRTLFASYVTQVRISFTEPLHLGYLQSAGTE